MKFMWILFGTLISCLYIPQCVNSACLCGAIGENYCNNECKSFRPVPKFRPEIPTPVLNPIGDKCSCGKQLVQPAIPPRICCDKLPVPEVPSYIYSQKLCSSCAAEGKATCSTCKAAALKVAPFAPCPCQIGPWIHANAIPKRKCGIPADPVSVSLAHQSENARSFSVPEEKVQYGHRTTPLCPLRTIYVSNIPEENLWAINRQIIELKKKGFSKKVDEEIIEEESEEEEDVGPSPNYLTYGELGYCPENFKSAKFKSLPSIGGGAPAVPECMLPKPSIGDCGFKPGAIVPFNLPDPKCTMEEHFEMI